MFSYSYFEAFILLVGALILCYCTYEEVVKRLTKEPVKTALKPHLTHQIKPVIRLARTVEKEVLNQTFTVELKSSKDLKVLTKENFKELLSPYFIAVDYLLQLWLEHPFNLIITDRIQEHYGKKKKVEGFIRITQIPDIYIKAKTNKKYRCGILIHEISHQRSFQEAKFNNVKIQYHGPEFKRHLRILFKPLLEDRTYYKKYKELSYHLTYESNRFTPTKDQCA